MKPFRRTGFNVPLNCPLPKCRARGSWGTFPHACFSCFVLFASSKENEVALAIPHHSENNQTDFLRKNNFVKFLYYACFFDYPDKVRRIGPRSGRAGPSFSVRSEKEAKGAVLHGTSAAERFSHVKTRSANLPKLDDSHRLKHMGRFVFALRAKIPSRATQQVEQYAALAFRQRLC